MLMEIDGRALAWRPQPSGFSMMPVMMMPSAMIITSAMLDVIRSIIDVVIINSLIGHGYGRHHIDRLRLNVHGLRHRIDDRRRTVNARRRPDIDGPIYMLAGKRRTACDSGNNSKQACFGH